MSKASFKSMLLLCIFMVGIASSWAETKEVKWVKVDPTTLAAGDSVVIVDTTRCVAMANDPKEGSAPKATSVTLNTNKDQLDTSNGDIAKNLKWVVDITQEGKYQFKKDDSNFLFAKVNSEKDSLLVGAGDGDGEVNTFKLVKDDANNKAEFLYAHMSDSKDYYVGVYSLYSIINSWTVRSSINEDISSTVITFFKRVESVKKDLEIKFDKDNYEFDLDGDIPVGDFASPVATTAPEEKTLTYSSSNDYVATVDANTGKVTIKHRGIATITASYAGGEEEEYDATSASYTLRVDKSNDEGGMNNPLIASDAYEAIKNKSVAEGVVYFVKGVVSQVGSSSDILELISQYIEIPGMNSGGGVTYYISDDGSSAENAKQIEVTSGRGLENGELKALRNICVGDEVIVVGQLSYSSSTPAIGGSGGGSGSDSDKTPKIDKGNYMHKYTPRLIAPDIEMLEGITKYFEWCEVNQNCEVQKVASGQSAKLTNDNLSYNENTGGLTAVKVGCDTITVSVPFKNNEADKDTLFLTEKKFYVTVTSRNVEPVGKTPGYFTLVTDASTLQENDSILIVAPNGEKNYAISSTGALMGGMSGKEVTIEEDGTIKTVPDGATPVKLKKVGDKWALNTTDKNYFYNSVNSGGSFDISSLLNSGDPVNKLRHGEIAGEIGDSAQVTITINAESLATISMRGDSILRYADTPINIGGSGGGNESNEGSEGSGGGSNYNMAAFNCYSKDTLQDNLVKIYRFKYESKFDITVGENGWRELVSAKNVELPEGLKAYIVSEIVDNKKARLKEVTRVKADIPYVLKGSPNTTYTLEAVDEEVEAPVGNLLKNSSSSTGIGVYVINTEDNKAAFNRWNDGKLGTGHPYLDKITTNPDDLTIIIMGDANCDGVVDTQDIGDIAKFIMGEQTSETFDEEAADANGDDKVNAADIVEVVNIISSNP